jgi:hypothetical protein
MAYAVINKTGCGVRKGNCQIRLDFYLEPSNPRYNDKYLYLVDTTSEKYLAGYKGEVDKDGNPVNQEEWDAWWDSLPRVWVNTPFHTHFIYLPADFTDDDIKAQIELHLPNFYQAFQAGLDEFRGGMRHGWDIRERFRPHDYSKSDSPVEYDARVAACEAAIADLTEFSYKPSGEGGGETFPATEIDIGDDCINRPSSWGINYHTLVAKANPANDNGIIDYCEIWLTTSSSPDIWVGTFSASGNVLTCRDSESIGSQPTGKSTVSGLDIDVASGDYFGSFAKSGLATVDATETGETGVWYYSGECIDPSDSQTFTSLDGWSTSLYGTGETEGGWSGTISGVAHPAKVAGVDAPNIAKVKGVA